MGTRTSRLQIDLDPQLEREADEAAAKAMSGEEPLVVNRMGADMHIQRSQAVTASNAKNIQELSQEVQELKETVNVHDETISEINEARSSFEESVEAQLDKGGQVAVDAADDRSLLERAKDAFSTEASSDKGKRLLAKGVAGGLTGGLAIPAIAAGLAAFSSPTLADHAAETVAPGQDITLSESQLKDLAQKVYELRAEADHGGEDLPGVRD